MNTEKDSAIRRLAVVLKDSNDAINVHDLQGNIIAWNRGAEKMYGYTEAEAVEMNIDQIVPHDKKKESMEYLEQIT
jgi:two-component system CheB/CheR fusion protein